MLDTLLSQVICLHGFLWPNNCVAWYHHPHSIECFKGLVQSLTNKDLNSRPVRFQSLAPLLTTRHPPPAAAETLTSRTSLLSTPVPHVHVRPGRRCCTRREAETAAQRGEGNCPRTNPELMVPREQEPRCPGFLSWASREEGRHTSFGVGQKRFKSQLSHL